MKGGGHAVAKIDGLTKLVGIGAIEFINKDSHDNLYGTYSDDCRNEFISIS